MFGLFICCYFFDHILHPPCVGMAVILMPVFGVFLLGQIFSDCEFTSFCEEFLFGEFDPGSGRTLAACLTHASRTERPLRRYSSGERVSNTWAICPALRDKPGKLGLIPNRTFRRMSFGGKLLRCGMGPRPISLLVG